MEPRPPTPALPDDPPKSFRCILGPAAARSEPLRAAIEALRDAGRSIEVRLTWEAGDARRWAREAAEEGLDAILAAGGDGTLNEVVNGLYDAAADTATNDDGETTDSETTDAPLATALAILPFGTANDFAAGIGLPVDEPLAALRALDAEPTPIDVGRAGDLRFLNVATGGFGAEVTAETHPGMKAVLGSFAYLLSGLARMGELESHRLTLRGPDLSWSGAAFALAVGNGRQAGGGIPLCPEARLDDGLLDVTLVPEMPLGQLLPYLGEAAFSGRYIDHDDVIYRQVEWLEVESDDEIQLNLDGQPLRGRSFRLELERRRLPLYRPARESGRGPISSSRTASRGPGSS